MIHDTSDAGVTATVHILITDGTGTSREWFAPEADLPRLLRLLDRYLGTPGRTLP